MPRQRLRAHTSPLAHLGRVVLVAVALALVWYGLMLVLLALKLSPELVDAVSGYRTAYDFLASLGPGDVDDTVRLIAAVGGLVALLLFGYLAWKEVPRPYLARGDLRLSEDDRGAVDVKPRAVERVAESAATRHPAVSSARGRLGPDDVFVAVNVRRARDVADALRSIQGVVHAALEEHGLPPLRVDVTLSGFDRTQRRELS